MEEEQQQMNGEEFLTHSSCSLQELEMILKRKLQLFPIPFVNNACISLIEEILREIGMYVVATRRRESDYFQNGNCAFIKNLYESCEF